MRRINHGSPSPDAPGYLETIIDDHGVFRVRAVGFWSSDNAAEHFKQLTSSVREFHNPGTSVAIIVDLREASAQSQGVIELLRQNGSGIYRPGDRLGLVVPSALLKMQLRRVVDLTHTQFFQTMDEAENWVCTSRPATPVSP